MKIKPDFTKISSELKVKSYKYIDRETGNTLSSYNSNFLIINSN